MESLSKVEIEDHETPENDEYQIQPDEGQDRQDEAEEEPLDVQVERVSTAAPDATQPPSDSPPIEDSLDSQSGVDDGPLYNDPSDEDDGEGEWITPSNVGLHKSRALQLLPDEAGKGGKSKKVEQIKAGCMTADFAMQNVLLQMGLSLVGVEGKRIERVKTWVLRCHACFKYAHIIYHRFLG